MNPSKLLAAAAAVLLTSCGDPSPLAPQVRVGVQALTLPAVDNAIYDITVLNDVGEVVWSRRIDSVGYGDGRGSLTYVGPCDAQDNDGDGTALNAVQLWVVELPPLSASDWVNPTANGPLVQTLACEENADTSVNFQIAIMREANQGFFDVMVDLDDIFCSAKLDCVDDVGAPIDLLHNPQTGQRDATAVMAFACTAGPGSRTNLHMDDVRIECGSGERYAVDPSREGVGGGAPPLIFGDLVMRGGEQLLDGNKAYWNVAVGMDLDQLGTPNGGHKDCVFRTRATASDGGFPNGTTPAGVSYPYVSFDVPLSDATGLVCTQHPLEGGNGVSVQYGTNLSFAHGYSTNGTP